MRILITGATGFVGRHLIRELKNHHLILTARRNPSIPLLGRFPFHPCDLLSEKAVARLIKKTKPQAVVHLAGQSSVVASPDAIPLLFKTNAKATETLCRHLARLPQKPLFILAGSSAVYAGSKLKKVNEKSPIESNSAYSQSKLAAEEAALKFVEQGLNVYIVRPFNHTGPGPSKNQVCPTLGRKIHEAKSGTSINVGNLNARRDFSDVRDVVRVYRLILEKKPKERVFVIGSGKSVSIKEVLAKLIKISGKKIKAKRDKNLLRSKDLNTPAADFRLARRVLGWTPKFSLNQTLKDIYANLSSPR